MKREEFLKIMNNDDYFDLDKDSIFKGLELFRKFSENADISAAEHDIVFCDIELKDVLGKITKKEAKSLREYGWFYDEAYESFTHFV